MRIILVLLLTGLTLGSCRKMAITERDYPRLKTEAVTNITKAGATFNASIIYRGDFKILNYGFTWAQTNRPSVKLSDRIIYTDNIHKDYFSADISSTLKEGELYYVRAFVETKDYLVYGGTTVFKSNGCNGPVIHSFHPEKGSWQDTVEITGEYFSYLSSDNHVSFNELEADVIHSTDTTISCVVPSGLAEETALISLTIAGEKTVAEGVFSLVSPIKNSFNPL
ncbi:MAG: IPT/TIG domain-containing protein [Bacteroidales bacterium]